MCCSNQNVFAAFLCETLLHISASLKFINCCASLSRWIWFKHRCAVCGLRHSRSHITAADARPLALCCINSDEGSARRVQESLLLTRLKRPVEATDLRASSRTREPKRSQCSGFFFVFCFFSWGGWCSCCCQDKVRDNHSDLMTLA